MNKEIEQFNGELGTFQLQRLPLQKGQTLKAWDAADEYLLQHVVENKRLTPDSKILIINDQFGSLACNLHAYSVQSWSDSYINELSTSHNARINRLKTTTQMIPSIKSPQGKFDIVLIKVPKINALLEDQLIKLKDHINADTLIISAAMARNIHSSTLALIERIIGTTTTSLAKKKARLIFSNVETSKKSLSPPFPNNLHVKQLGIYLKNHANVFSKSKLDYASLLMIEQFKQLPAAKHIVDLGCGNGVLGIMAQRQLPEATVSFLDESYMAVDSAKMNYENIHKDKNNGRFIVSDGFSQLPSGDVDLVLCNPPFHQQHTIGDHIAWRMFTQSFKRLNKGGTLWVVGNLHLQYLAKLKKIFGNSHVIETNKKFQIIAAIKK